MKDFKVSVVVTRENAGQLDAVQGAHRLATAPSCGSPGCARRAAAPTSGTSCTPPRPQQRELYDWLLANGDDVLTGDSFFHLSAFGEALPGLNLCGAGRVVCLIDPVGDVYACPFAIHENFLAGNVRDEGGFQRVWQQSELFADLRSPQTGGACTKCAHFDSCRGGCMAAKFFTGLPLDGPDPECVQGYGETALAARDARAGHARAATSTTRTPARSAASRRCWACPAMPPAKICDESPLAGLDLQLTARRSHPLGGERPPEAEFSRGTGSADPSIRDPRAPEPGRAPAARGSAAARGACGSGGTGRSSGSACSSAAALVLFAWLRGYGQPAAVAVLLAVAGPAALASVPRLGRKGQAAATTLSLMAASAALVHLWQGVTESHFIFFVMIGVVSLYQDWVPYGIALVMVIAHHGILGTLYPHAVFSHDAAHNPWLWAGIHAAFVLAASLAHLAAWRLNEDQVLSDPLTGLANRTLWRRSPTAVLAPRRRGRACCSSTSTTSRTSTTAAATPPVTSSCSCSPSGCAAACAPGDVVARLGGDEFAVVVDRRADVARAVGERVLVALAAPVPLDGGAVAVHGSIGVGRRPSASAADGRPSLLRNADLAMYLAKAQGKNRLVVYADGMAEAARRRADLAAGPGRRRGVGPAARSTTSRWCG